MSRKDSLQFSVVGFQLKYKKKGTRCELKKIQDVGWRIVIKVKAN